MRRSYKGRMVSSHADNCCVLLDAPVRRALVMPSSISATVITERYKDWLLRSIQSVRSGTDIMPTGAPADKMFVSIRYNCNHGGHISILTLRGTRTAHFLTPHAVQVDPFPVRA